MKLPATTTTLLVASTAILPAFATVPVDAQTNEARELTTDQLELRAFLDEALAAGELTQRDVDELTLDAREPLFFIPGLIKGAKMAAKGIRAGVQARNQRNRHRERRNRKRSLDLDDFEDVVERDLLDGDFEDVDARELVDLDLEDVEAREPLFFIPGLIKGAKMAAKGIRAGVQARNQRNRHRERRNRKRDLEDLEELLSRALEWDDLD